MPQPFHGGTTGRPARPRQALSRLRPRARRALRTLRPPCRRHAGAKAVTALAHQLARLIGPLHRSLSACRGGSPKGRPPCAVTSADQRKPTDISGRRAQKSRGLYGRPPVPSMRARRGSEPVDRALADRQAFPVTSRQMAVSGAPAGRRLRYRGSRTGANPCRPLDDGAVSAPDISGHQHSIPPRRRRTARAAPSPPQPAKHESVRHNVRPRRPQEPAIPVRAAAGGFGLPDPAARRRRGRCRDSSSRWAGTANCRSRSLVRHRAEIDAFVAEHRLAAWAAFIGLYIVAVALSLPGAVFLTIAGGLVFGTLAGGPAAIIGGTIGATILFLIAKTAVGGWLVAPGRPAGRKTRRGFPRAMPSATSCSCAWCRCSRSGSSIWCRPCAASAWRPSSPRPRSASFRAPSPSPSSAPGSTASSPRRLPPTRPALRPGRSDCRLDFDLKAAATPELIAAVVVLGLFALLPIALKRFKWSPGARTVSIRVPGTTVPVRRGPNG